MHEPAVTLTDYGLTIECWLFAFLIARGGITAANRWWVLFFSATGAGSLIGGSVHGFLPDESTLPFRVFWDLTLLAIGGTAVAAWNLAAQITGSPRVIKWTATIADVLMTLYVLIVVLFYNKFLLAIVMYLPATIFLTVVMSVVCVRDRQRGYEPGIVGLILTYVGAAVQQLKVDLHPVYFDHNVLFHVIQAVAFYLLFLTQRLVAREQAKRPA